MKLSDIQDDSLVAPTTKLSAVPEKKKNIFSSFMDKVGDGEGKGHFYNGMYMPNPPPDVQTAVGEGIVEALTGATPKHPELQAKNAGLLFPIKVAYGTVPYMVPGALIAKFTAIPAAHEIVRQSTDQSEDNKSLNMFQRTGKVATAGGLGFVTGRLFQKSDLLKTIVQRVGAKAAAGGTTSAVNSLAQDVESGKEPDIHAAMLNAATNAAVIGLLGAGTEIPSLRAAITGEASRIAGRPLNVEQSKKFLTTGKLFDEKGRLISVTAPTNPESLSPALQNATAELKRQSVMNGIGKQAADLGVSKEVVKSVMRDRNVAQRLSTLDEQIYQKIKSATGRNPVFDWRDGKDYQWDYSKMNPIVKGQLETLLKFRKQIAAGADPAEVLFSYEVSKQMKVKDYISDILKNETRNTKQMYAEQAKSFAPTEKPTEFFSQGKIESVGPKESIANIKPPNNSTVMAYLPYLQRAIDETRQNPNEQRKLPDAAQMNDIQRDRFIKDIKYQIETGATEQAIVDGLKEKLTLGDNNPLHEVSVLSSHQGKEDAAMTPIYDWRNMRSIPIREYVADLKQYNLQRVQAGLPEIDLLKDILVHRSLAKGQNPGVAKQVRETIIREYKRVGITKLSQLPVEQDVPVPTVEQATQQAGEQAQLNLAQPMLQSSIKLSQVDATPTVKLSEAHTAPVGEEIKVGNHHIEIPTQETVHEEQRQSHNDFARTVVEGRQTVHDLAKITGTLKQTLGRNPTKEEIAQAAGISVQDVRDILTVRAIADEPQFSDDDGEWQAIKKTKNEVPLELTTASDILKDLYEGTSGVPYEQAMEELLAEQTKKSLGKTKAKDVFKKTDPFKKTIAQKQNDERAQNLADMSKSLSKHRSFLGEKYLAELAEAVKGMSSASKRIVTAATKHLTPNSMPEDILFSIHDIGKEIDNFTEQATPIQLSVEEAKGGVTFNVEQTAVHTSAGIVQISGEQNWSKQGNDFTFDHQGEQVVVPKSEFLRIAREGLVEVDYSRYMQDSQDAEPRFDEKFEVDDKPWSRMNNESGQLRIPVKVKILKHTELERDAPTPIVLKFMRDLPFVANLKKYFKTTQTNERETAAQRELFKVPDEAHEAMWSTKVYESAVRSLAQTDLQPILDDTLTHVQEQMKRQGSKDSKKKEVYQKRLDVYSELMAHAAEQVLVKSKDPNNFGFSKLGHGPHNTPEEIDAYIKTVKKFYQEFQIPLQDQIPDAQLATARTPVFWDLLVHPNVMFNDRLQMAILFYKAQIELPLLEEQIKNGIYSNADIYRSIQEGYHKHGFAPKGTQADTNPTFKRGGMASIQRPQANIRTLQEHIIRGETEGWTPIGDFFNNNFDYMVEAMRGIKQAQLLQQMKTIRMPKLEYESPEFIAALAKNPTPHTFHWVEHSTNANVVEEAERMTKILGKEVTPMKILQEGGWIMGHMEDGLDKWYRGSFQPPFLYRTLYNEARTLWRSKADFESLGGIAKMIQKLKFSLLSVPTDGVAQYLGNVFMERPIWKVVPYVATLGPRTMFYAAKGLGTGLKIAKGEYTYQVGKTPHEIAWNRLFMEEGMTSTSGYRAFLSNVLDKADRGVFVQRQDRKDDLNDWFMSIFGMNQAVMGEMVAEDVLKAAIAIAEHKVSQGASVREAAKFTAHYMNTATWNLHRDSWQGSTGVHLRNWTTSRNFAVTPIRTLMLMARAAGLKTRFRTSDGGGKEGLNTFTGADVPERFAPEIGWKFVSMFTAVLFTSLLIKMTLQAALSAMGDGESKGMFENPPGAEHMIDLGMTDVNGRRLYLDFGLWRNISSMADITATGIDPMLQGVTGNEDIHTGRGALQFMKSKLSVIFTVMEVAGLKDNFDGTSVYDNGVSWDNAKRFAAKVAEFGPTNPFVGPGAVKVPYSRDPLVDMELRALNSLGFSIKPVESGELQKMKKTVASEMFKQKEETKNIFTVDQASEALKNQRISKETFKNKVRSTVNPVGYFQKRNKRTLIDARRRTASENED